MIMEYDFHFVLLILLVNMLGLFLWNVSQLLRHFKKNQINLIIYQTKYGWLKVTNFTTWLQENDTKIYSTHKERKICS